MPRLVVPIAPPDLLLAELIDQFVMRQDDVGALTHQQPAFGRNPALGQRVDLLQEHRRVDDGPLADDARCLLVKNARRDQVQNQLLPVDDQRVAGVCAAGVSDDEVGVRGVEVDDLALAFVPPLRSHNHQCTHDSFPTRAQENNSSNSSSPGSPLSARERPSCTRVRRAPFPCCQINRS